MKVQLYRLLVVFFSWRRFALSLAPLKSARNYCPITSHSTVPSLSVSYVRLPCYSRKNMSLAMARQGDSPLSTKSIDAKRPVLFTIIMALGGATLGPFLDSYHSAFGVLEYEEPITMALWGTQTQPALTTAWWVPELFGLAGIIIGWLYVLLDRQLNTTTECTMPGPPKILIGVSVFTFQYWLSGALFSTGVDRTTILNVMSVLAGVGFLALDNTVAGLLTSFATAVGGPLIEIGLLSTLTNHGGYQYSDKGEFGFFPLWIVPVYFLGGPAVGNLARGIWNALGIESSVEEADRTSRDRPKCEKCNATRAVPCPNCGAQGYYVTYGRKVMCNCCRGRGLVICRDCFSEYDEDPSDIEAIREIMARMPD